MDVDHFGELVGAVVVVAKCLAGYLLWSLSLPVAPADIQDSGASKLKMGVFEDLRHTVSKTVLDKQASERSLQSESARVGRELAGVHPRVSSMDESASK